MLSDPNDRTRRAALDLQSRLADLTDYDFAAPGGGKMLGVLVVRDEAGTVDYLSAFSGQLDGAWHVDGFVPPVFDVEALSSFWPAGEAELGRMTRQIAALASGDPVASLRARLEQLETARTDELASIALQHDSRRAARHARRAQLSSASAEMTELDLQSRTDKAERVAVRRRHDAAISRVVAELQQAEATRVELVRARAAQSKRLLQRIHDHYLLTDPHGTVRPLRSFFATGEPPGGTGDCSAPKLLNFANRNRLRALGLTEFWWGAPLSTGDRRHGAYYSACENKCGPIMKFLSGS